MEYAPGDDGRPQLLAVDTRPLPDGRAVLRLAGELDLASCGQLRDALNAQLLQGRTQLVLDMGDLEFIDSSGLSVLVEYSKKAICAGGQLALAALRPKPARIIKITSLDRVIPIYATTAEAVAATVPDASAAAS